MRAEKTKKFKDFLAVLNFVHMNKSFISTHVGEVKVDVEEEN